MERYDEIVAAVRRRIDDRKRALPLYQLRALTGPVDRPSFVDALRAPGLSLIAEVRRGVISDEPLRSDADVADLVGRYQTAGASAIAVVTESEFSDGTLEDLATAVRATSLPVLQKDFFVDEYQLHEARAYGASAVLLTAALLRHDELVALGETAVLLGLDVLVEVRDEDELAGALSVEAAVIAISGDSPSDTVEASMELTFRLTCRLPVDRLVVSETGVRSRQDSARLEAAGVDGVLVGEHLVRSDDVEAALRELQLTRNGR